MSNKFLYLKPSTEEDFQPVQVMSLRGFGDMPIGGSHYGPMSGRKDMPFVVGGVTAAVGVLGAVATTGVTMAVVGAAVTVVAAAAVVAGVAMTVVGAITGDKDLMKIGAIVGIAGGVAGLAAGAMSGGAAVASEVGASAAEVAAPAASSTVTTAAQGGLLSGGNMASMSSAITPAFGTAVSGVAPVAATAGESALSTIGTVGSLGSSAYQAVAPASSGGSSAAPSTYIPPDSLSTKGANAPSMPVTIGPGAPVSQTAPDVTKPESGGYFSELMSDENLAAMTGQALMGIGTGVIKGMGSDQQYAASNKQVDINQQEFDLKKMQDARANANANTQGYNGMTTKPLTQAEYDQAKLNKARIASQTAGLLTQSA